MPKNSVNRRKTLLQRGSAALALALLVIGFATPGLKLVNAAASCSTITDCTNQINASTAAVGQLKDQATSYQDAITRLQSQTGILEGSIADNESQQASLQQQISDAEAQITADKAVLGDDIRTMYVDGQLSTIEELATSSSLSNYVDKEEYRTAVQDAVQSELQKIADLQASLQSKQDVVTSLLAQQRAQASQLADDQSQQSQMLSYDQSQQAAYNAQTAQNQSKLSALIAAQRSANVSSKGGYYFLRFPGTIRSFNPSAYPYANAGFSMSTAPGCNNNDGPDPWGYCTRQCVSYTAWAVQASGRNVPMFWGNAKNWVAEARSHGVPVYNTPQPGDVAISTAGTWGHAMYVQQVSGKQIYVSQYNQQLTGQYSTQWRTWE